MVGGLRFNLIAKVHNCIRHLFGLFSSVYYQGLFRKKEH